MEVGTEVGVEAGLEVGLEAGLDGVAEAGKSSRSDYNVVHTH